MITVSRAALLRPGSSQHVRLYVGDALATLQALPSESVHCVVTSPPYYGLRDYGVSSIWGGDPKCPHEWEDASWRHTRWGVLDDDTPGRKQRTNTGALGHRSKVHEQNVCRCGAWRGSLGLEPTPAEYVAHLVEVFRGIRRVLRPDGTVWLNLGDSYCAPNGGLDPDAPSAQHGKQARRHPHATKSLRAHIDYQAKPKDLLGIPWMVAFALRADGWWLRSEVIWRKPNPMPESTIDRPTRSHEQLFLLTKSARYYYDAAAIAEPSEANGDPRTAVPWYMRNKRSVWSIATEPFPGAHFATFPTALVEPCVLAGTSEKGVCGKCGAPWLRMVENGTPNKETTRGRQAWAAETGQRDNAGGLPLRPAFTTGWQPTCVCNADPVPATILDPFAGSGTVGLVADRLGRDAILIELNPEYVKIARKRLLTA